VAGVSEVPHTIPPLSEPGSGEWTHPIRSSRGTPGGWLALADGDGLIDLRRLLTGVDVRVESRSGPFADALATLAPSLVVVIAPPAGPADLQLVARWRAAHQACRAVLLSPHQAVAARLHALELGFDDAVDLASDPLELVGRLSIAARTTDGGVPESSARVAIDAGIELDLRARAIRRNGQLLWLRPRELALLAFLTAHPGRAYTRSELLRQVWHDTPGNERVVDVYVFWLRAKVEPDPANPVHLLTVRGSGYLFEPGAGGGSPTARGER
jgi:DNA-binding response OmpR family regulator